MSTEFTTAPATPGLLKPKNVFDMQNNVSDGLNEFQEKYSRYVRCQNDNTAQHVDPPCDLNGSDSFVQLNDAYKNLHDSLDGLNNVYDSQVKDNKSNEIYQENQEEIDEVYDNLLKLRSKLDKKLAYIQENADTRTAPVYRMLQSRILINTLLTILLLYLIYILFFDIL